MKKTLALLLALALVFSSITVAFADEAISADAKASQTLGMLVGDGSGVTASYLATAPTRIQAAVMFLRLKGLENEAKAFTGVDNFADAEKAAWAKPIMAYLKANANLGWAGTGNGSFDPNGKIDAKSYYKVMLETLGYKQNTTDVVGDFTWDNLLTFAAEKGLKAVAGTTNFTVDNLATATVEALKTNVKGSTKTLVASLVEAKVITEEKAVAAGVMADKGVLALESVVAKTASTFLVKFTTGVEDTTKVAMSVKRNNTTTAVTTTWNEAKTEATLTFAGVLPVGDYTIGVKVGEADFGTKTVEITKQKVAKIEILGTALAVTPTKVEGTGANAKTVAGNGFVSYQVFDQYNVDITKTALANSGITFNASVGSPTGRDGIIEIKPFEGTFLTQFPTATITALCADSAISTNKSLTISLSAGTLSEITLNKVVNVDNKEVKANDTISKFYIDYTALDINGNPTKESKLVDNGLMFNTGNNGELLSSYPNLLNAKIAADPADSTKTVIVLEVKSGQTIYADTPVVITAMTKTGKSSSITVTVKKPATVDVLTLLTPAVIVAEGDKNVEIPYEAFDQNGNKMTDYADIALSGDLSNYTGIQFEKNPDGSLRIVTADTVVFKKGVPQIFQAVTKSGKSSMITIKPDEIAYPYALTVDSSVLTPYMQLGAEQTIDLGSNVGGLKVTDQFGRTVNLLKSTDKSTYIEASLGELNGSPILENTTLKITQSQSYMGNPITFESKAFGTQSITFKLKNLKDNGTYETVATRTVSVAVIENKDITGITVDEIPTIYAAGLDTAQKNDWFRGISVYGKTKYDGQVTLSEDTLKTIQYFVDNSTYLTVDDSDKTDVKMRSKQLPNDKTETTGNLVVSLPINSSTYTATTAVKATSAAPAAAAITLSVTSSKHSSAGASESTGFTVSGNTVTGTANAIAGLQTTSMFRHNTTALTTTTAGLARASVQIRAKDQYGKYAMTIPYFKVVDQKPEYTTVNGQQVLMSDKYSVNATNGTLVINRGTPQAGDWFMVSAVASNGQSLTVKFVVSGTYTAPATLQSIAITKAATKTIYKVGETLDIAGLEVTGTYSDATTKKLTITKDDVAGFSSASIVSNLPLVITVNGKTTGYVINVIAADPVVPTLDKITTSGAKAVFAVGEDFASTGLTVTGHYSNNTTSALATDKYTVNTAAYDKTKAGTYVIVVTTVEGGKSAAYAVEVKEVTALTAGQITPNTVAGAGDNLVFTGLVAGDVVKVYDAATAGTEITGTLNTATFTFANDLGTAQKDVWVTVTSTGKLESARIKVTFAAEPVSTLTVGQITPATTKLDFTSLVAGDVVKVYDAPTAGNAITGTLGAITGGAATFTFDAAQASSAKVYVTVTSTGKLESARVEITIP